MTTKTSGLGRGLSALMGEAHGQQIDGAAASSRGGVREIEIGRIKPNPNQPRMQFTEESIAELAESIAQRGVLQPILLRPNGEDGFEIIAGERRWHLHHRLGGLDLGDRLVDGDLLAGLNQPAHELGVGEPLAEVGEGEDAGAHARSHCNVSTASSTRSTLGR